MPIGFVLLVLGVFCLVPFAAFAQAPKPKSIVPDAWQGDRIGPSPI